MNNGNISFRTRGASICVTMATNEEHVTPVSDHGCVDDLPCVTADREVHRIKGSSLVTELRTFFTHLRQSNTLTDLTIVSTEDKFEAHSLIMAAHSTYIRDLVLNNQPQTNSKQTVVVDAGASIVSLLLEYVYKGEVAVPGWAVRGLMTTAAFLGMRHLRDSCHALLLATVDVHLDNCLDMWAVGETAGDADLIDRAKSTALESFSVVCHHSALKALPLRCLLSYLSDHRLQYCCADDLLTAALTWVQEGSRVRHLGDILDALPLHKMSSFCLEDATYEDVIQKHPEARQRLTRVLDQVSESVYEKPWQTHAHEDKEPCLVFVGHQLVDGMWLQPASNDIMAVRLDRNCRPVCLGQVEARMLDDVRCCVLDSDMYVCGLGDACQDIWRFSLDQRAASICGRYAFSFPMD